MKWSQENLPEKAIRTANLEHTLLLAKGNKRRDIVESSCKIALQRHLLPSVINIFLAREVILAIHLFEQILVDFQIGRDMRADTASFKRIPIKQIEIGSFAHDARRQNVH